jgi:hypothetical protein
MAAKVHQAGLSIAKAKQDLPQFQEFCEAHTIFAGEGETRIKNAEGGDKTYLG